MDQSSEKKSYKTGEIIMQQGDMGQCAYIIEEGRVEIVIAHENEAPQSMGTRGAGTIIGEMALVDNAPRTATVRAIEDCTLLEITKDDFRRRLKSSDPVLKMITQVILTRYRDTLTRAHISGESRSWPPVEMLELSYADESDVMQGLKMVNEFKGALEKGEITLYYQPIISLQDGTIQGYEALMRWEHPQRGFISPSIFIPVIEQSGLIVQASQWALEESCYALKRIEQHTGLNEGLFMSVNFTGQDFASEDFVSSVYNTISKTDLAPQQVHIEITERMLIDQPENARDTLNMCRKAGMSIAIDDFGTGYSSLSYLHYFPIDTLKIDRSFVADMHKNDSSMALIRSIIALGKNMKMKIIAEGVEEKEEAQTLRDLGCDLAQGFYFAKPMPELDVTRFTNEVRRIAF